MTETLKTAIEMVKVAKAAANLPDNSARFRLMRCWNQPRRVGGDWRDAMWMVMREALPKTTRRSRRKK
jgi:hypothetical protein